MKYAVFSDVHGNLPALELMLKDAGKVDGYICLGDVVNYGPWSNECVERISSLDNVIFLEGNHERDFLDGAYSGTNEIAKTFYGFCQPKFSAWDKIKNLPQTYELNGFVFSHTIGSQYIYPDSALKLDGNYVVGHSHHQFKISQPPFGLYNPGSVGQNRKYINIVNYALLETAAMEFTFRALSYDVQAVIEHMKKLNYPKICIEYYDSKQRFSGPAESTIAS